MAKFNIDKQYGSVSKPNNGDTLYSKDNPHEMSDIEADYLESLGLGKKESVNKAEAPKGDK